MSNFKIILTGIFGAAIVFGLAIFAMSKNSAANQVVQLKVWGTVDSSVFNTAYENSSIKANKMIKISYVKKDPDTFEDSFVNALADGNGPDLVILPDNLLYKNRNRFVEIPFKSYPIRNFKDTFVEGGEVLLSSTGVVGLPFTLDPLVMYWNRSMFTNALVALPPKYWDEFNTLIPKMTKRDSGANVMQGALALGEYRNISNAKEILSLMFLQAGTPITQRTDKGVSSVLNDPFNYPIQPSVSALNFYTQFSNPTSPNYTWNRSLPLSQTFFLSGNLATYIGFASEIFTIQKKNANLDFDVTYVPQIRNADKKIDFARLNVLAIVKQSKQVASAFVAMNALVEPSALTAVEKLTSLPPVRRDLLSAQPSDQYRVIFYNSALISHTWIDPDTAQTDSIFRDMIESVTSGRSRVSEALSTANNQFSPLFK